jgi:hypothetical protein
MTKYKSLSEPTIGSRAIFVIVSLAALALLLAACAGTQPAIPTATPARPEPQAPSVAPPARPPAGPRPSRTPAIAATPTLISAASATPNRPSELHGAPSVAAVQPASPTPIVQAAERRYAFPVRADGTISYGKYHHDYHARRLGSSPRRGAALRVSESVGAR